VSAIFARFRSGYPGLFNRKQPQDDPRMYAVWVTVEISGSRGDSHQG
jgi:hypothetical protein